MADDRPVTLEQREDGVALIRLDRPKANALSTEVLAQLRAVVERLADEPPGAVVIWGGDRIFAAGADIKELVGTPPETVVATFHAAFNAIASLPRVTIAAVNGYALGGGCELALACDLRICAEDAVFGLPEITLGLIPGGGGTQRLARLVGVGRAKELVFTGRQVTADEALAIGLVNKVVSRTEVLLSAMELASELARGPLVAEAMAKRAIDQGLETTLEGGLQIERGHFIRSVRTEDAGHGLQSFLDDGPGKATFVGR
ncbi:MAG TPA: enoyl-CoA hydratase-related protein [Acidimicrobiales bacterium]|nr:enoyl-CoA hydratase-related protein [Acidimicrobiales bacterium]